MARRGGLLGRGGIVGRVSGLAGVEVVPEGTGDRLLEAGREIRSLDRELRNLGWRAYRFAAGQPQDMEPEERHRLAAKARLVADADANVQLAVRLRNAFCWGRGLAVPKAKDDEVQAVFDEFWRDRDNQRVLTSFPAQLELGRDLWTQANVSLLVHDEGSDGRVKLDTIHHDLLRSVRRDQEVRGRILYWIGREDEVEWDDRLHAYKSTGRQRTVYWTDLDGELGVLSEGREMPAVSNATLKRGRVVHVAINKGREQAFGTPELKASMRWAAGANDILAGQVEKAKAAQQFLMKVRRRGPATAKGLMDDALRAIGRRSPLGTAGLEAFTPEPEGPNRQPGARPGSELWETDALTHEPFSLDSGASGASEDINSARQAFAAGTNFPGHYYGGDPGSLAGSMAVELPVLKLTELDQELLEGVTRTILDHVLRIAIYSGKLSERRPLTDEEFAAGLQADPDGMVARDLRYVVKFPSPLRRNLPEFVAMLADVAATFDPQGVIRPLNRYLLGQALTEVFEEDDTAAILDEVFPEDEQDEGTPDDGGQGGPERETSTTPEGSVGPDGKRHTDASQLGAKTKAKAVEAAVLADVAARTAHAHAVTRDMDALARRGARTE